MSEFAAPVETLVHERLARRQAVAGLASSMLYMLGTAQDRWRSYTWQEGDTTYVLNRGDGQQHQTQMTSDHADWLYVSGPEGDHDAYCLDADSGFAAPDLVFEGHADAIFRHASALTYELACARLDASGAMVRLSHDNTNVVLGDFRNAQHEPFIWARVGVPGEQVAYDLTAERVRFTDRNAPYGPVGRAEQPETHLRWMLGAMVAGGSYQPADTGGRATMYTYERHEIDSSLSLGGQDAEDAHSIMRVIAHNRPQSWRDMEVITDGEETVARCIVDRVVYDYETRGNAVVPTAVGLYYNGVVLHLEAFAVQDPNDKTMALLHLKEHTGIGATRSGDTVVNLRGSDASREFFEHTDAIGVSHSGETLHPCPPNITALFEHQQIRTRTQQDTVQ